MRGLVSGIIARRRTRRPAFVTAAEATRRLELLLIRYAGATAPYIVGSVRCWPVELDSNLCQLTWSEPAGDGVTVRRRHVIGLAELQRLLERSTQEED